jgi:hypothetical protein
MQESGTPRSGRFVEHFENVNLGIIHGLRPSFNGQPQPLGNIVNGDNPFRPEQMSAFLLRRVRPAAAPDCHRVSGWISQFSAAM